MISDVDAKEKSSRNFILCLENENELEKRRSKSGSWMFRTDALRSSSQFSNAEIRLLPSFFYSLRREPLHVYVAGNSTASAAFCLFHDLKRPSTVIKAEITSERSVRACNPSCCQSHMHHTVLPFRRKNESQCYSSKRCC